jgi:arylsulfatase A-like enzyme
VALLLVCAALVSISCHEVEPPDVIVITVDTLRADHLGVYEPGASTPHIDALAAEGTVFERGAAPMPLTRPSHFSMWTSLYPREHGVLNNAMRLPEDALTLSEILADYGYRTGGFVGVRLLGAESGAGQGFHHYDQPTEARERSAEEVIRGALEWLDGLEGDDPVFVWIHLFDPHLPYAPPEPFRGGIPADRPALDWTRLIEIAEDNDGDIPRSILDESLQLYRGEVSYVDHWTGELLAGLERRLSLDETLVVFTADHGECFENGVFFEHADCLWQPAIHVPLIVRYPPAFGAGIRSAAQTSLVDVTPTVLRAAGIAVPAGLSGLALQDASEFEDRQVLVQYPFYQPQAADRRPQRIESVRSVAGEATTPILIGAEKVGLVGREWKYLRAGDRAELYAMTPVPDERDDRIAAEPEVAERMREQLERQLARHPLNVIDLPEINEELLETLRALGYL